MGTIKSLKQLKGHRAVVTGASSGIGEQYAKQLAALGVNLVLAARRLDRLDFLAEQLRSKYSVKVDCVAVDLGAPGAAKKLFDAATSNGQSVTLLINNAGLGKYGLFMDFPLEDHQAILQVNSVSPTELTYFFVRHMLKHGQPSWITQVASIAAFQSVGNFSVYSATKSYLRIFSETLAFELRKTPIKVMCLCPGGTYTEFFEQSGQKITPSGHRTMMTSEAVVQGGLKAMLNGNTVFVPGLLNKLACFFPRFLPRGLSLFLAFKAMSRAVEKV